MDIQEAFTRRIMRRVSQRRERERSEASNFSAEIISEREINILRAINDPSASLGSSESDTNDRDKLEESNDNFRDSFNLSGYYRNDDNNNDEKSIGENVKLDLSLGEPEKLLKFTEDNVQVATKIIAELKNINPYNVSNAMSDLNLTQLTRSPISSLDDIESRKKILEKKSSKTFTTEAVVEMCNRVSSILTDIRCDSAPLNEFENDVSSRSTDAEEIDSKSAIFHKKKSDETILKSTKKSAVSDSANAKISSPISSKISDCRSNKSDDTLGIHRTGDETEYQDLTTDRNNSNLTASELVSENLSPLQRRVTQALNFPATETPSRHSGTLDKSMRIYRTLSQRIKNKFRPSLGRVEREDRPIALIIPSRLEQVDKIQKLLRQVNIQQSQMNQATKALNLCKTVKEFTESIERVESERSLLLASLRGRAALEEIKWMTTEDNGRASSENFPEKGEVTISEISLDLRECLEREREEEEFIDYFVIVVSQALKVWSTRPIICPVKDSRINFPGKVSIPNLTPSFKILVQVYSLKLRRVAFKNEDKYRIDKNSRSKSCLSCSNIFLSPRKFFGKVDDSSSSSDYRRDSVTKGTNTCFALCGFTELILHDLSVSAPWPLMLVPSNSKLKGSIDLNLSCRLHFSMHHQGFLNHGDEAGGFATWNRRWCVLEGHTLKFWNYPREQETKDPLTIVELMNCVSNEVTIVDRTICAKPRTLLIETERSRYATDKNSIVVQCKSACTIVRNLLSYDSARELNEWSQKLNQVILALEEWNVIGQRSQPSTFSNL